MAVVVYDAVAHAGNLVERYAGELRASLRTQARGRFHGHQDAPQNGILRLAILQELLARLACNVALNDLDRTKDIEEVCGLLRRNRFHVWIGESSGGGWRSRPARRSGESANQPRIREGLRAPYAIRRNPSRGARPVETSQADLR